MAYSCNRVGTPVGTLELSASDKGLSAILWEKGDPKRVRLDPLTEDEFQKSVWNALLAIPFGETRSYDDIARQIGKPTASGKGLMRQGRYTDDDQCRDGKWVCVAANVFAEGL